MPDPRSLVGRLLSRKKKDPTNPPPTVDTAQSDKTIEEARQATQKKLERLAQMISQLEPDAPRVKLDKLATTLRAGVATLDSVKDNAAKSHRLMQVNTGADKLIADLTETLKLQTTAAQHRVSWATSRLDAIKLRLKKAAESTRQALKNEVDAADNKLKAGDAQFLAGEFAKADAIFGEVYHLCTPIIEKLDKSVFLEQVVSARKQAQAERERMAKHKDFETAFKKLDATVGQEITAADQVINQGLAASKDTLSEMALRIAGAQRSAKRSQDEYQAYGTERQLIDQLVKGLRSHAQTSVITAEIGVIEGQLAALVKLGATGGWHRAKLGLTAVRTLCTQAKTLADGVETNKGQAGALSKGLEGAGVDKKDLPRLLAMSQKLMVQEKCSVEDAVAMARTAGRFGSEAKMDEPDALASARLVNAMRKADPKMTEQHAFEIGRQLRGRGSATMEDMACVAESVKRMPAAVLKELNDHGIVTGVCRGPVTDMLPELNDVNPRGWGSRTWDEVPGVYKGDKKMVVVGTMDDGGKRKIPGPSEGPVKHGTNDLLGHEAGHAFDVADGTKKRDNADFVKARKADLAETGDNRLKPERDDYFMTTTESGSGKQSNDDAARSETFAESFAMFFDQSMGKWPNLKDFWSKNPWAPPTT